MIPADTPADKLNLYAGFCNIALGCGASLGGFISGYVSSKVGGKRSGNIGIILFMVGSLLVLSSLQVQAFWLTLLSVFFWGFFLFYIEGWLFIICSR
jgi:predicted MFS family arabinose efflux permease